MAFGRIETHGNITEIWLLVRLTFTLPEIEFHAYKNGY